MKETPLQLYKRAYNLHYKERNIEEADKIYQQLILDYPESEIAWYCSIQHSRIAQQGHVQSLHNSKSSSSKEGGAEQSRTPLFISLLTFVVVIALAVTFYIFTYKSIQRDTQIQKLYTEVNVKLLSQKKTQALELLSQIKQLDEKDITPYIVSSEIYLIQKKFRQARLELDTYHNRFPEESDVEPYLAHIAEVQARTHDSLKTVQKPESKDKADLVKQEIAQVKKVRVSKKQTVKKKSPSEVRQNSNNSAKAKPKKSLADEPYPIDTTNVSFF